MNRLEAKLDNLSSRMTKMQKAQQQILQQTPQYSSQYPTHSLVAPSGLSPVPSSPAPHWVTTDSPNIFPTQQPSQELSKQSIAVVHQQQPLQQPHHQQQVNYQTYGVPQTNFRAHNPNFPTRHTPSSSPNLRYPSHLSFPAGSAGGNPKVYHHQSQLGRGGNTASHQTQNKRKQRHSYQKRAHQPLPPLPPQYVISQPPVPHGVGQSLPTQNLVSATMAQSGASNFGAIQSSSVPQSSPHQSYMIGSLPPGSTPGAVTPQSTSILATSSSLNKITSGSGASPEPGVVMNVSGSNKARTYAFNDMDEAGWDIDEGKQSEDQPTSVNPKIFGNSEKQRFLASLVPEKPIEFQNSVNNMWVPGVVKSITADDYLLVVSEIDQHQDWLPRQSSKLRPRNKKKSDVGTSLWMKLVKIDPSAVKNHYLEGSQWNIPKLKKHISTCKQSFAQHGKTQQEGAQNTPPFKCCGKYFVSPVAMAQHKADSHRK